MLTKFIEKYWFYKFRIQRWIRIHNVIRWIRKRWAIMRQNKIARQLVDDCSGVGPKTDEEKMDNFLTMLGTDVEHFEHLSQEVDPHKDIKEILPDSVQSTERK